MQALFGKFPELAAKMDTHVSAELRRKTAFSAEAQEFELAVSIAHTPNFLHHESAIAVLPPSVMRRLLISALSPALSREAAGARRRLRMRLPLASLECLALLEDDLP